MTLDQHSGVGIQGTGSYVPEKVLDNAYFEKIVDTSDEWIVTRTGIRERRILPLDQANSNMAVQAAERALEAARIRPQDVDLILVGTVTGDTSFPSTACYVQSKLKAPQAAAFDIGAACSGFIYTFVTGYHLAQSPAYRHVLVIGSEVVSRITDYQDRNTCVLFGDAAGAMVLSQGAPRGKVLYSSLHADGSLAEMLWIPGGGTRQPISHTVVDRRLHFIQMKGRELFKLAVQRMGELILSALEKMNLSMDDIDVFVPHQMNERIMEALSERFSIPMSRFFINIEKYGNTGSASIPLAFDEALGAGRIKPGDKVALFSFGGGLTWGIVILEW